MNGSIELYEKTMHMENSLSEQTITGKGEIVIYQPDEITKLEVRLQNETVWLTQMQIATIFNVGRPAVTKHINNIYSCGELDINSTCSILEHMGNDGAQCYNVKYFNLDVILSVGYRVNSKNAIAFRRWASCILKDYLLRGYSINSRISQIEDKFDRRIREQDKRIEEHERKIDFFVRTSLPPVEGVFFEGQVYDAYAFVARLIRMAQQRIILIDNYIDDTILTLLDKREDGVNATIYTYQLSKQLKLDINKHNAQYAPIKIKVFTKAHDRFLIIDNSVYLIGASLKDLGKKWFGFTLMEHTTPETLLNRM